MKNFNLRQRERELIDGFANRYLCSLAGLPVGVSTAMTLGGTLLQGLMANQAANKQQSIINAASAREDNISKKNIALAMDNAQSYDPKLRDQRTADAASSISNSLASTLAGNTDTANTTNDNTGNVSKDFSMGKAKAVADRTAEGIKQAHLLGAMRAPSEMRLNESYKLGDTNAQIAASNHDIQNIDNAARVDANGVQTNGLGTMVGGLLSNIGTVGLTNAAAGKTIAGGIKPLTQIAPKAGGLRLL